jgi:galactokinase
VYELRALLEQSSHSYVNDTLAEEDKHDTQGRGLLDQIGALMNSSMDSAEHDGEFSCPELSELVRLARAHGAVGSRSTGAGWGGATVSLVPEPEVDGFIRALRDGYYAKKFPGLSEAELNDACFATKPEAGAGLFAY